MAFSLTKRQTKAFNQATAGTHRVVVFGGAIR